MIIFSVLLYVTYIVVMNKWGHQGDMEIWMRWSKYMHIYGLSHVYDVQNYCNYLPGFLYILWLNTKIQHTDTNVQDNLYIFKLFVLVFDFIGAYLAVYFVKDWNKKLFAYLFILVNTAFVFNTLTWAQVDAIFTCFGFAAVIAALNRKLVWSIVLLVIALNFKLQAIVFIPAVGLLLLPPFIEKFSIVHTLKIICSALVTQVIMIFPFLIKGHAGDVWKVVSGYVGQYPYVSASAFNFWFLTIPGDIEYHVRFLDTGTFIGLSYKNWGFLLFFLFMVLVLYPLIKHYFEKYFKRSVSEFPLEKIFLVTTLTAAGFFYFNTEMHERYFHPALISLAAYTFLSGNYFPFVLGSVAYFLNLERILWSLALTNYNIFIFQPVFVAVLFGILILYLLFRLYSPEQFNEQNLQLTT